MAEEPTPEQRERGILADVLSAGITFPACVVVGYLGGSWLDRHAGTGPFGMIAGMLGGLAAALVPIFRLSRKFDRLEEEKRKREEPK